MHADLEALLVLQEMDQAVRVVEDELAAFDPAVAALDAEVTEAEGVVEAAKRGAEDAGTRRSELEEKIENFRQMQERRRQRLEWVRGAKEASTLMAELDLGRSVLAKEEAEWMRSADRVQEAQVRAAEAEQALEDLRQSQTAPREEIAAKQADCRERLEAARKEREKAAKKVSRPIRAKYERILQGRAPMALYALHGEACGHCFTSVPMHRRQEIHDGRSIVTCEACGVLVYHLEIESEDEGE